MNVKRLQALLVEYKNKLANLDSETLRLITQNRSIALEYAERGIGTIEPESLNEKYIETIANEMQVMADMLLQERR